MYIQKCGFPLGTVYFMNILIKFVRVTQWVTCHRCVKIHKSRSAGDRGYMNNNIGYSTELRIGFP